MRKGERERERERKREKAELNYAWQYSVQLPTVY